MIDRRTVLAGGAFLASQMAFTRAALADIADAPRPVVRTRNGPVAGRSLGAVNVFKGIPYAKPPLGRLRFRPTEPIANWQDTLDAGAFGPGAIQTAPISSGTSEDCLTANIWAPVEPGPHPVLFWIHGGGNTLGSAGRYDGTPFAQQGVVFVSVNYRLGAFGFLELGGIDPAYAGSGCNGLLDLREALRWVRNNIASFGGNPDMVSIMGQSAGARNVLSLTAMPSARALFHRAASQSGSGLIYRSLDEASPVAKKLFSAAGLGAGDLRGLVSMPAKDVLAAQGKADTLSAIGSPWRPTAGNRFMPYSPNEAARRGDIAGLDVVIGTVRDEEYGPRNGAPLTARQFTHAGLDAMRALETRYAQLLPQSPIEERHLRQLTAETFWIPSVRFAEAQARAGGKVWMYRFDRGSPAGYAQHGCDTPFVFGTRTIAHTDIPDDADADIARVNRLWATWARTGALTLAGGPKWPRYDDRQRQVFIFDRVSRVESDPRGDERDLWDGLM